MGRKPLLRELQHAPAAVSVLLKALTAGLLRCRRAVEAVHEDMLNYSTGASFANALRDFIQTGHFFGIFKEQIP